MDTTDTFPDMHSFVRSIFGAEGESADVANQLLLQNESFVYVEDLLQSDIAQFQGEEVRLAETSKDLHASKAALVLENYTVLLEASSQLEIISRDLPEMRSQLQNVSAHYSTTDEQARSFWSRAGDFEAQRTKTQQQSSQLGLIQDLLEIPSLIDNLARHSLFDEVVDLVYFVEKLSVKTPEGRVVQAIVEETRKRKWVVMRLLSHQLRTVSVHLLQALKIVSLERRLGQVMNINVEEHVRTDFLQARSVFINGLVRAVPQKDVYQFLTKLIEICRLNFFDTLNFYLSIFPDSSELPTDLRTLPYVWLQEELGVLCVLVEKSLPQTEDSRLEPLFNQCLNFSEALSRFGSNISTTFFRIFLTYLLQSVTVQLKSATDSFSEGIKNNVVKKSRQLPRGQSSLNAFVFPEKLFDFPFLAELFNTFVNALNRLRLSFIPSLNIPLLFLINQFISEVSETVSETVSVCLSEKLIFSENEKLIFSENKKLIFPENEKLIFPENKKLIFSENEKLIFSENEKLIFSEFENIFYNCFLPAVKNVRDALCSQHEAANIFGVSLQQISFLLNTPLSDSGSGVAVLSNGHFVDST